MPGMAEIRRIPLESAKTSPKKKKGKEVVVTQRFTLDLTESNEKSCPEFAYPELIKSVTPEIDDDKDEDAFGDEDGVDEKLRDIARKMEEKYGQPGKKKRMGRWEDYVDRGIGYDENDPFIDNEEAYDELVPSTLTTQYGGFYINSGELEFRNVSESESSQVFKPKRKRRKHKEQLEKVVKRRKQFSKEGNGSRENSIIHVPKKRGRKPTSKSPAALAAEKSALSKIKRKAQPTVAVLLEERKAQLQQRQLQNQNSLYPLPPVSQSEENQISSMISQNMDADLPTTSGVDVMDFFEEMLDEEEDSPMAIPIISDGSSEELDGLDIFEGEGGGLNTNINNIIESVVKNSDEALLNGNNNLISGASSDSEEIKSTTLPQDAPKLPENLPVDLYDILDGLKKAALVSAKGKCKFFSGEVNQKLLSIEVKTRELSCTQRSMIYSHLASFLPCTKETLLKRAKKLRYDQEGGKLADPMQRLRRAVNEAMPPMIEKYKTACANVQIAMKLSAVNSEEPIVFPKKKFEWNDRLRLLLCEVVRIKLKCYEVLKMRAQSAHDYLLQFLDYEVKQLWPKDWMTTRILLKESRSAHTYITALKAAKASRKGSPLSSPMPAQSTNAAETPKQYSSQDIGNIITTGVNSDPTNPTFDDDDLLDDLSLSSSKLVIASPNPSIAADSENISAEVEKSAVSTEIKKEVKKEANETPELTNSPSKRIFTLMNPEETAAQLKAHQNPTQPSFAAEMLDRIICASLANFPNSGTSSLALPEIGGRPIKADLNQLNQLTSTEGISLSPSKNQSSVIGEHPSRSSVSPSAQGAVSILKSNYQSPPSVNSTSRTSRNPVIEHAGRNADSSSRNLIEQGSRKGSHEHGSCRSTSDHRIPSVEHVSGSGGKHKQSVGSVLKSTGTPTMPYQAYEFQEAFKRSLGFTNVSLPGISEPSSSKTFVSTKLMRHRSTVLGESHEEPVNFSTSTGNTAQHYTASQELNRLASVTLSAHPSSLQHHRTSKSHRVSPEVAAVFSQPAMVFPEGMKGFPMPLKVASNSTSSATSLPPPLAHSYSPSRRTSPSEVTVISNSRPNSLSPHQIQSPPTLSPSAAHHHRPNSSIGNNYSQAEGIHSRSLSASSSIYQLSSPPSLPRMVTQSSNLVPSTHIVTTSSSHIKPINRALAYSGLYATNYPNNERPNQQSSNQRLP